jgi:GTP cyclohydrolase I
MVVPHFYRHLQALVANTAASESSLLWHGKRGILEGPSVESSAQEPTCTSPQEPLFMSLVHTATTNSIINQEKIAAGVRMILEAIGEDPDREGLRETPKRVAKMYADIFHGLYENPRDHLTVLFDEAHDEMVLVKDVPFYSMCEHHLLPFQGKAHIAYLPCGKVVGLSKIVRVVEAFARRPQVQERLTSQIADLLMTELDAHGVAVVVEASHTCMTMRGVRKPGANVVTSAMRGTFITDQATRSEFMSLVLHSSRE